MPYSITNIRKLELFKPILIQDELYDREDHDDFPYSEYFHFPVLLKPDHSLWGDGSLYLLSKLESSKQPHHSSLYSQAKDLIAFMNFIEEHQIDYLEMPKRKAARPTYRFRFHLQDLIKNCVIKDKTASRRMNAVINFYRWISDEKKFVFKYPPWIESTTLVNFENYFGLPLKHLVKTTDLSVRVSPSNNTYTEHLDDGGKLRPLLKKEQSSLINALGELENIEMMLMFLLALSTGARLQTICTLRLSHLEISYKDSEKEVGIVAGPGTLIDTKLSKRAVLYIPVWMIEKLKIYSQSSRALERRQRNTTYGESLEQYVFLTKGGHPYYMGKNDPSRATVKRMPTGNAITQFIRSKLLPKLNAMENWSSFHFHDLRATYGMNLVEINQEKLIKGEISYQKLKDFIKERMWHKSSDTTDAYLQFKSDQKFLLDVQEDYERHLLSLMREALNF